MGFWQKLRGKEPHCVVCGQPIREPNPRLEHGPYCSELCMRTIERLSSHPPRARDEQPPPDEK